MENINHKAIFEQVLGVIEKNADDLVDFERFEMLVKGAAERTETNNESWEDLVLNDSDIREWLVDLAWPGNWCINRLHDDFHLYLSLVPNIPWYTDAFFNLCAKTDFSHQPGDTQQFLYELTCVAGVFAVRQIFLMSVMGTAITLVNAYLDEKLTGVSEGDFTQRAQDYLHEDLREILSGELDSRVLSDLAKSIIDEADLEEAIARKFSSGGEG